MKFILSVITILLFQLAYSQENNSSYKLFIQKENSKHKKMSHEVQLNDHVKVQLTDESQIKGRLDKIDAEYIRIDGTQVSIKDISTIAFTPSKRRKNGILSFVISGSVCTAAFLVGFVPFIWDNYDVVLVSVAGIGAFIPSGTTSAIVAWNSKGKYKKKKGWTIETVAF